MRGAVVDLAGSAVRELREETGLALPGGVADAMAGEWALLRGDGQLAFLYPARFPESAAALAARMERHRLAETEPELERVVTVRAAREIDAGRMPPFVRAYLASAFTDAAVADVTP